MIKTGLLLSLVVSVAAAAFGQPVPTDRDVLLNAQGAGMASYADWNGFPGPKHVLEMQDELQVTEDQEKLLRAIYDEMSENAIAKGARIIEREEQLEELFRSGKATEEDALALAAEIGTLRGELRAVHLAAHIQAREVLTDAQLKAYTKLRRAQQMKQSGSK